MGDSTLEKIQDNGTFTRFLLKNRKGKIQGDVSMKLEVLYDSKSNLNVQFTRSGFSKIDSDKLKEIDISLDLSEKIKVYKELDKYDRMIFKSIIYSSEYARYFYLRDSQVTHSIHLTFDHIGLGMSGPSLVGAGYATVKGIWDILNFTPKDKYISFDSINIQCIFHQEIDTKYVARFPEIDESEGEFWSGIDEEEYEKSRSFQWML
ncbi:MAG: hypothetical protein AAFZ63_28505 [Bacteroidota bacterium]